MKVQEALNKLHDGLKKVNQNHDVEHLIHLVLDAKSALSDIEKCEPVGWTNELQLSYLDDGDACLVYPDTTECPIAIYTSPISKECEPINEVYAFEKWLKENTLIRASLNIDLDYADPLAEIAYRAWKARAKLNAEKG